MTWVRFIEGVDVVSSTPFAASAGDVRDLPPDSADRWIRRNKAVPCDPPTPKAKAAAAPPPKPNPLAAELQAKAEADAAAAAAAAAAAGAEGGQGQKGGDKP